MKIQAVVWTAFFALSLLAGGCTAPGFEQTLLTQIAQIRQATQGLEDIPGVEASGYAQFMDCVHEAGDGAMGIHFVNGDFVGDAVLDLARPEAILFEPGEDGAHRTGVEYIVFAEAWRAEHSEPPTLMGQPFTFVDSPNRYDLPPFYALHVWLWKTNPNGLFADWNPAVTCPEPSAAVSHSHTHHTPQ